MAHPGRRHEIEHPFEQAVARAQDRDQRELLPRKEGRRHLGERRSDGAHLDGEVARHLVAKQQRNLGQELPELRGLGWSLRRMMESLCWTSG